MMKVVVKSEFRDIRNFDLVHPVGQTLEVDEERGKTLIERGLAEQAQSEPQPKEESGECLFGNKRETKRNKKSGDDDRGVSE